MPFAGASRAAFLPIALAALAGAARGDALKVPEDFATLQEAVTAAVAGDTILVSGRYELITSVVVPQGKDGLIIRGKGTAVIDGAKLVGGTPGMIEINSNHVTVSNLTLQHAPASAVLWPSPGGPIVSGGVADRLTCIGGVNTVSMRGHAMTVTGCSFRGSDDPVEIVQSDDAVISKCTFFHCDGPAIEVLVGHRVLVAGNTIRAVVSQGIAIDGDDAVVEKNTLFCFGSEGIAVSGDRSVVRLNELSAQDETSSSGIQISGDDGLIEGNDMKHLLEAGIEIDGARNLVLANTIGACANNTVNGAIDVDGDANVLEKNKVTNCGVGGAAVTGVGNILRGNTFKGAADNGVLVVNATDTLLEENKFLSNEGEGVHNDLATNTMLVGNTFLKNRIDIANTATGTIAIDPTNVFTTGGADTLPEIDL